MIRGWMFSAHLLWVEEYGAEDDLPRIWSSLEPEISAALADGFDVDGWFPFAWLIVLDRAIHARVGDGVSEEILMQDLGRFSARLNLSNRFEHLTHEDQHEFFRNLAGLHRQFQDFGDAVYQRIDERRGSMTHSLYPCYSRSYCHGAVGYYEQCLLMHGAAKPVVYEQTCQCLGWPSCRFELRWR